MYFGWGKKQLTEKTLWGYPVVTEYKYLGGFLDNKMKASTHLTAVARKLAYIQRQLIPIRLLKDLRLNVNLFRTMCLPSIRMGLLNGALAGQTDRANYFKAVRAKFKAFCFLPKCLPNAIVNMLLGDQ